MRHTRLLIATFLGLAALIIGPVVTTTTSASAGNVGHTTNKAAMTLALTQGPESANWASWGRDLSGSRYAGNQPVNPSTVSRLAYKWAFTFPLVAGVNPGSQPAVVGNMLYVGSSDPKFYALNAKTGATEWVFDLTSVVGSVAGDPDPVRDGPAVADGSVYFGDSRGYIFALNEYTGQLEWDTLLSPNPVSRITASPVVYDGKVFVGVSSQEAGLQLKSLLYQCCTGQGQMDALNARTGAVEWRHYTVGTPEPVGYWPSGATEYAPSGGSVEDAAAIDPAARTLYVGTGQNATGTTGETDSLVALNIDTGQLRWYYKAQTDTYTTICDAYPEYSGYCPQAASGTALDWDMSSGPNLFHIHGREVVGVGEKSGVYRVFDARTGRLIWSRSLTADPYVAGGSAGIQWGTSYDGTHIYAATWGANPGVLFALDPDTGAIDWQTTGPLDGCTTGGAVGTSCSLGFTPAVSSSKGLVYEGSADGKLYIFSSANGDLLWQFDTTQQFNGVNGLVGHGESVSGLGGAVVSGDMVYVQSGYYPIKGTSTTEGTVLLAFGLPGR